MELSKAVESSVLKNVQKNPHISCVSVLWPCDFNCIICETHLKFSVLFCCFFPFREVRFSIKISIKKCKQVCTAPYFKNPSELAYLEGALEGHSSPTRKSWQAPLPQILRTFCTGAGKEYCCPLSLGDLLQCGTP